MMFPPARKNSTAKKCRKVCGEQRASVIFAILPHFETSCHRPCGDRASRVPDAPCARCSCAVFVRDQDTEETRRAVVLHGARQVSPLDLRVADFA
jgi:hypothetical protein